MRKGLRFLMVLTGLLLSFNTLFAQGTGPAPCGDPDDPNYNPNMCPIDSWVVLLVIAATAGGYIYLKKKEKRLQIQRSEAVLKIRF